MATYYVSKATGDDGDSGLTEELAWATIGKAMATVAAGDTIYVKADGTYTERLVIATAGTVSLTITFEGYTDTPGDGGQVTVDAASVRLYCLTNITSGDVFYVLKNFIFKRATIHNVYLTVGEVIFKNCQFTIAASRGCVSTLETAFEDCLFDGNGTNGATLSSTSMFIGCRFADNTTDGIQTSGNTCIYGCVSVGNGGNGIETLLSNGSQAVILGCTIDGDGKATNTGIDHGQSYWKRLAVVNTIVYDCLRGIRARDHGTYFISRNNLLYNNDTAYVNFQTFTGEVLLAPQFEDEAGGNYALASGSPARDAGYDGYSLNGSSQLRDIGAVESTEAGGGGGAGGGASRALKDGSQMT